MANVIDRRRVAWSARGHLVYVLALPLLPALLAVIERGELTRILLASAALGAFVAGAIAVRFGARGQRRRAFSRYASTRTHALTWLGCGAVAAGCFVCQRFLAGNDFVLSGMMALAGFAGAFLSYGSMWRQAAIQAGDGYSADEIGDELRDAEHRVQAIESVALDLPHGAVRRQLKRITVKTYHVLHAIERDPTDLRRARKFLNVFLPGIEGVSQTYVKAGKHDPKGKFASRFRRLLDKTEEIVDEQQGKLRDRHIFDLDVQMDVLRVQIEADGR